MPFCTGQGTSDVGGCCHLGIGGVCPHYKTGDEARAWVEKQGWSAQRLTRARNMAQGVDHACDIAIQVVAVAAAAVTDRARFEKDWINHPQYVADVRPYWAELEERSGYPENAFNCPTWQGGNEPGTPDPERPELHVCCFGQDEATCEAQAAALHSTAVSIRRAGGY